MPHVSFCVQSLTERDNFARYFGSMLVEQATYADGAEYLLQGKGRRLTKVRKFLSSLRSVIPRRYFTSQGCFVHEPLVRLSSHILHVVYEPYPRARRRARVCMNREMCRSSRGLTRLSLPRTLPPPYLAPSPAYLAPSPHLTS